jgi:hypothetical protein
MATSLVHVQRGDLITADFVNSVIDQLLSQDSRISALEAAAPTSGGVAITGFIPIGGSVRVGDTLSVLGRNFGFVAGATTVYIDSTRIDSFLATSSDQLLVFKVPTTFTDVPSGGRFAKLSVSNQTTADQKQIFLLPAMQLSGNPDVPPNGDVQPNPIAAGVDATFPFLLVSNANLDATYAITPVISGTTNDQAWQQNVQVRDQTGAVLQPPQIKVGAGKQTPFSVVIHPVPASAKTGDAFTLAVIASAGSIQNAKDPKTFTVGVQTAPTDTSITIGNPTGRFVPSGGTSTIDANGIHFKSATAAAQVTCQVTFSLPAVFPVTYEVDISLSSGTNWSLVLTTPPGGTALPPTPLSGTLTIPSADLLLQNVVFTLRPTTGQTPSPSGAVQIIIKKSGATSSATKTIPFDLS